MFLRKPISLIAALLLATSVATAFQGSQTKPEPPAPAPTGVTGTWIGSFVTPEGQNEKAHFVLKQTGAEVTGTAGPSVDEQFAIAKGKVETTKEGTKVTFQVQSQGPLIMFDLTLAGDRLKGTAKADLGERKETATVDVQRAK